MSSSEGAAIVVGAGPVGLAAALALRARNVPATVIEAGGPDRTRPGSRAIYQHRVTLEILERNVPGLGRLLAEHGLVWPTKRTLYKGREVFSRSYKDLPDGVLPPLTSLPQVEIERLLLEACKRLDVDFVWDTPVASVRSDAEGVEVIAEDDRRFGAGYVVGADGARSVVRSSIGAQFEGARADDSFVIVDVSEVDDDPLPLERVFHYADPRVEGRNLLLVPFQGGWRVDLQCLPDDDPEQLSSDAGVKSWLSKVLPERYADRVTWVSVYRFHQVVSDTFIDPAHRVLLAGEAAHLFAPFGARGLNSGVPDAETAAAAIQQAVNAAEPAVARAAVAAFNRERREAALWNRHAAGVALDYIQARRPRTKIQRGLAAALAPRVERAGKWLDSRPYGPRLRAGRDTVTY